MTWVVAADSIKNIVLKGVIQRSQAPWMYQASMCSWFEATHQPTWIFLRDETTEHRPVGASRDNTNSRFATSTYLFPANDHDSGRVAAAMKSVHEANIFTFTITNNGDRPIRVASTTINVAAEGGFGGNNTATGVGTWQLWEASKNPTTGVVSCNGCGHQH